MPVALAHALAVEVCELAYTFALSDGVEPGDGDCETEALEQKDEFGEAEPESDDVSETVPVSDVDSVTDAVGVSVPVTDTVPVAEPE